MLRKMKLTTQDKIIITKYNDIEIHTKITRNKSAYLRPNTKGYISFSRPVWMNDLKAAQFIEQNIDKMSASLLRLKSSRPYSLEDNYIKVYGRDFNLSFQNGRKYIIDENTVIIKGSKQETALANFIKNHSFQMLERAKELATKLNIDVEFSLSNSRSYWGVCYPTKKMIKLSTRLMHFNWSVIDYVILHELAHTYIPNHSKKFWDLVESWVPNYKEIKKELKRW